MTTPRTTPRTIMPDGRAVPRWAGICTFARCPELSRVDAAHSPVDWAVYGAPFDGAVSFRPGARFGPRAIREESQYVKPYHIEHGVNVAEVMSLVDAGDAPIGSPYDMEATTQELTRFAKSLGGVGGAETTRLLALGGDHSIALPNMRAVAERFGPLALVHIDTHVDTLDTLWGERYTHASPFSRAVEEGVLEPSKMVSVGIKGPLNTPDDLAYPETHGNTIITFEDWKWRDGAERLRVFLAALGDAPVYVSFDIDAVDPAFAPGTGTPCPGGFTSAEALQLLRGLSGKNVVGGDVVEVLPDRDPGGITAFLAAHVAFEIIALDAVRRAAAS